jgi:hypothetical protein
MGRYAVVKRTKEGPRKVGVLRTRYGVPVALELREAVQGECELARYAEDGEPTVSRGRLESRRKT